MKAAMRRALLMAIGLAGSIATALAQSGGGYELLWSSQDAGAATMSGDSGDVLVGTIGQSDAGVVQSGNGGYTLRGGFWPGAHAAGDTIFRSSFDSAP